MQDAINAEATSQPAAESVADPESTPPDATPPAASPAGSEDAQAKARAERLARLEALKAEERQRVDDRARKAQGDRLAKELEQERARASALEARAQQLIDISKLDEASFFQLAQKANIHPQKLGEWIRDSLTNPEILATKAARTALDPQLAEMQAKIERQEQAMQAMLQQQQQERAQAEARHMTQQFLGMVSQSAEHAPLSARFLEKHGANEFLKIAETAGAQLPAHAGPQAVLDAVESFLDGDARTYAQGLAELYGLTAGPSQVQQTPPPKSAAAKAKTVSNANAQERASVVNDNAFARLSFDERLEALKRSM